MFLIAVVPLWMMIIILMLRTMGVIEKQLNRG